MKNYLVFFLLCACIVGSDAQDNFIKKFCDKYEDLEDVFHLNFSGEILNLTIDDDNDEDRKVIEKISAIRMLFAKKEMDTGDAKKLEKGVKELEKDLKKSNFEDLMEIRDGASKIDFMLRENDGKITDVLMLIRDKDTFGIISVEGLLKFSDLNNINIDVEGGTYFKNIPENRKDVPRA